MLIRGGRAGGNRGPGRGRRYPGVASRAAAEVEPRETTREVAGGARHGRLVLAELGEPALLRGGAEELREVRMRLRHLRHLR